MSTRPLPVRSLPADVADRARLELARLSHAALLRRYAALPGRTAAQARKTRLGTLALIDVIVWTEHRYDRVGAP